MMLEKVRDVAYLSGVFTAAFAVIVISWALVGVALGVAYRAFMFVVG